MRRLNYEVLKEIGYSGYLLENAPEKVLQFGEGAFLRAFVDYWFDLANERARWNGKCVLVKPTASHSGIVQTINDQEGLYTLHLRGREKGEKVDDTRIISSVSRCLNPYVREDNETMMAVAESDDLEIIVSNTTEAGIVYDPSCQADDCPPSSFPAKLTQVLYRRYLAGKPGVIVLACELIDDNGRVLQKCVNQYIDQWGLDERCVQSNGGFKAYVNEVCTFCGSLVDRIVPGRVRDPEEVAALEALHGYTDALLDVGEVFGLWVIEGDESLNERLPFEKAGLRENVFVTPDMRPYKKRKVRILNGAHTGFALGAYLAGENIVRDCMQNPTIKGFMNKMLYEEVIPTLAQQNDDSDILPESAEKLAEIQPIQSQSCTPASMDIGELRSFAAAVEDRFNNPFVDHELLSISLNSTAKWKARNLPSLLEYVVQKGELPICLTTSLAAYIAFYSSEIQDLTDKGLVCVRPDVPLLCRRDSKDAQKADSEAGSDRGADMTAPQADGQIHAAMQGSTSMQTYTVTDDRWVLEVYYAHRGDREEDLVHAVLTNERMWGQDLTGIVGLESSVVNILKKIRTKGAEAAFLDCLTSA